MRALFKVGHRKAARSVLGFNRSFVNSPFNRARVPPYGSLLRDIQGVNIRQIRQEATPKRVSGLVLILGVAVLILNWQDIRHLSIATVRTCRIGLAATRSVLEYRSTYSKTYESEEDRLEAMYSSHSHCHCVRSCTQQFRMSHSGSWIYTQSIARKWWCLHQTRETCRKP